jgi:hypothetical protein
VGWTTERLERARAQRFGRNLEVQACRFPNGQKHDATNSPSTTIVDPSRRGWQHRRPKLGQNLAERGRLVYRRS